MSNGHALRRTYRRTFFDLFDGRIEDPVLLHLPGERLPRVAVVCEFLRQRNGMELRHGDEEGGVSYNLQMFACAHRIALEAHVRTTS